MALRLSWDAHEVAEVIKITTFGQTQLLRARCIREVGSRHDLKCCTTNEGCAAYVHAKSL